MSSDEVSLTPLTQAPINESLIITALEGSDDLQKRLADLGIFPGIVVVITQRKLGQLILQIRGSRMALGKSMGAIIMVKVIPNEIMKEEKVRLNELQVGQKAVVAGYSSDDLGLLQRMLEMGLTRGTNLEVVRIAPMGDPMEIHIRGYNLSVRLDEARLIEIDIQTT